MVGSGTAVVENWVIETLALPPLQSVQLTNQANELLALKLALPDWLMAPPRSDITVA